MSSDNNIKIISMTRKIQVLDRFAGYCQVCGKQTSQILAYVYRKEKICLFLLYLLS
jgi:hypothetical protein